MNDLIIDFEWEDPLAAKGAELRATWARLSISIDSCPLTRVFDLSAKSMRKAVYLPLYPLAEWLVERWWPLWTEPSLSSSLARAGYDRRHSLVHAREGYALPPIKIEPVGSIVRVSWHPEVLLFNKLEFTGQGEAWIETSRIKDTFSSFIEAIVTRLEDNDIIGSRLQEEWAAIRATDAEEKAFCECAGALGLDPYDLDDSQKEIIERAGNLLPQEIVTEFFSSARSGIVDFGKDVEEVKEAIGKVERNMLDLTPLKSLVDAFRSHEDSSGTPWEQGYSFAHELRAHLGLDGKPLKTIEFVGDVLGVGKNDLHKALGEFSSSSIPFAALVGINAKRSPAFILRPARPAATLFHFCRALFEYLYTPMPQNSLITDSNTEKQKRNRAFAAEFLAPASALRDRIKTPIVTWEQAEELADEFGVSVYVIDHQLKNHCIASMQQA
jgi:hypothetical protein